MPTHGVPRSARAWLRSELAHWRSEGLVDERAALELERRYGLSDASGTSRALFAVYLVGCLLIGSGALSFVAWNWDRLPGAAKLGLGAVALAAAYGLGYWLAVIDGRRPLLGHALILLGSLLFGANIGIVAQVFQHGGEFWQAAGLWAAGAALAAWVLRNQPSGLLAALLAGIWAVGRIQLGFAPWAPYAPAVVLLPLAFFLRSPFLFGAVALTLCITLAAAAAATEDELVVASTLASASLLIALSFALAGRHAAFAAVARRIGTVASVVIAYAVSFHEMAAEVRLTWEAWAWFAVLLPQLAGLVLCLALAARAARGGFRGRRLELMSLAANGLLFLGGLLPDPEVPLTILANLALCLTAGFGIAGSIHALERRSYWTSVNLVLLVVVSRFLEYETGLLVKAAVFIACGAGVLVFGLSFERRVGARKAGHA